MRNTVKPKYIAKTETNTSEGPMTTISLRMPQELVEELKEIAPKLGFSGYQPLIRAYVGQGLQADKERLSTNTEYAVLVESLRNQGVSEQVLGTALAEARAVYTVHSTPPLLPINNQIRKERERSWLAFIAATYGSFGDEPLERPEQGILEEREMLR